jgi:mRNA interferase MazF
VGGRIPDAGDILWVDFGQPVGHEQASRRPALVITPASYNDRSSLLLVCPITGRSRPWPFRLPLPPVAGVTGFIVIDQIRAVDPLARRCKFAGTVPRDVLAEVRRRLAALLFADDDVWALSR